MFRVTLEFISEMFSGALRASIQEIKPSVVLFTFKAWMDAVFLVKYAIYTLLKFPLCGGMKHQQGESRLSRLVSDYKATSPYMTREPCAASFQHRGQLFTEKRPVKYVKDSL